MLPFTLHIPTRVYFGAGEHARIGRETAGLGRRALVVTGKASARRTGLADQVTHLLAAEGVEAVEFGGIDPNPRLSSCRQAAAVCRREKVDVIVAVGGGSVLDAAKTIAAAARDDRDIWDVFLTRRQVQAALPLVTLVTLAATGSELNPHSVITNEETGQKFSLHSEHVYPRVSILDPALTVSVPREPTVYGAVDIIAHVLEGYITAEGGSALSDRMVEGLCRVVTEATERVLARPDDLDARSELMWCSTMACSGIAGAGYGNRFYDGHQIGHELSATYDLAHGATLSGLMPGVMRFHCGRHGAKIAQFGRRVFGLEGSWNEREESMAARGIRAFAAWCSGVGAPVCLKELGVGRGDLPAISGRLKANPEAANLSEKDVVDILTLSYE
jgi:alcohol dehydrogenase YqhD (iron-dependent ADH family)